MQEFVATAGGSDTTASAKGDSVSIQFAEDVTDYQLDMQQNGVPVPVDSKCPTSAPPGPLYACGKGTTLVFTSSGIAWRATVTWNGGSKSYTLNVTPPAIAPSPCPDGMMLNPAWLVAQALGNPNGVAQCIPLQKTASAPVSGPGKLAIAASVVVVAGVGVAYAASRGAFTGAGESARAIAREAAENIRRSRV